MTRVRALALSAWLACMGCAPGTVTRVIDGETMEGRSVAPEAYAAYAKAELFAARGDKTHALQMLEHALDKDPGSPELLTRYGELSCDERHVQPALERFEQALELDPSYAPAFLGRARCRARTGNAELALADARVAAAFDPMSLDTTREVARLLFALHRPKEAWLWLEARELLEPSARGPRVLLLEAAEREHDTERAATARRLLASTSPSAVDRPLEALPAAPRRALDQAERRLAADPEDADAWIAGLVAADLLGDDERFRRILPLLGEDASPVTPRALALLAELIGRRCGTDAVAGSPKSNTGTR